jgi:hypothetical protein
MRTAFVLVFGLVGCVTSDRIDPRSSADARLRVNVKLVGLVVFFIFLTILHVNGIGTDLACKSKLKHRRNFEVKASWIIQMINRFLHLMFAAAALAFSYRFRMRQLSPSTSEMLGLSIVLSATLSLWFYWSLIEPLSLNHEKLRN